MSGKERRGPGVTPKGHALRRALRWMSDEGRHDAAAVEEACRRFDLSPVEEEFLLMEIRRLRGSEPS
ncbi:MAG: hypothetical protein PVI25_05895 [Gammaproteobacteria bacterium]|jgi:hypothetical protein|nr:MAG: hypothetical protein AMJ59_16330 [Gammaproteobacteria bacterium SG8_31]